MLHGVFYPCAMGSDTGGLFSELPVLSGGISCYRNSSIRQYALGSYARTGFSGTGREPVNYFVVSFRSSPLVPWDLYSLRTAASVADNYTLDVSWRLYFVLMGFLWLAILGEKTALSLWKHPQEKTPALRCGICRWR